MLTETINNLAEFLTIEASIIMNIITVIVVAILILISLASSLEWVTVGIIYAISMIVLQILGIESVFNIITLIISAIEALGDAIFMGVTYGN